MRRRFLAPLMTAFLLLACQMAAPDGGQGIADEAIAVTPLEAPVAVEAVAGDAPVVDEAVVDEAVVDTPVVDDADVAAPQEPEAPKTAEQVLCEKARGQWVAAGETGAYYCASLTRDAGKQCSRKSQCEGLCLARSRTCAPVMPLYGCNDVLERDGRQVTLCID